MHTTADIDSRRIPPQVTVFRRGVPKTVPMSPRHMERSGRDRALPCRIRALLHRRGGRRDPDRATTGARRADRADLHRPGKQPKLPLAARKTIHRRFHDPTTTPASPTSPTNTASAAPPFTASSAEPPHGPNQWAHVPGDTVLTGTPNSGNQPDHPRWRHRYALWSRQNRCYATFHMLAVARSGHLQ